MIVSHSLMKNTLNSISSIHARSFRCSTDTRQGAIILNYLFELLMGVETDITCAIA
jgi:hypothetical protein